MATIDPAHYRYTVQWNARIEEFVGTVSEIPSLTWRDAESDEAMNGIRQLAADVVTEMKASGEEPPVPLADREFSGKFMLRISPELHRHLASEALELNISLNRLIVDRLTVSLGSGSDPDPR